MKKVVQCTFLSISLTPIVILKYSLCSYIVLLSIFKKNILYWHNICLFALKIKFYHVIIESPYGLKNGAYDFVL